MYEQNPFICLAPSRSSSWPRLALWNKYLQFQLAVTPAEVFRGSQDSLEIAQFKGAQRLSQFQPVMYSLEKIILVLRLPKQAVKGSEVKKQHGKIAVHVFKMNYNRQVRETDSSKSWERKNYFQSEI